MPLGQITLHPLTYLGIAAVLFQTSAQFRGFLYHAIAWRPWREFLFYLWNQVNQHPWLPALPAIIALAHVAIRYRTSRFSMNEDYLYIQTGLLSLRAPGGPFALFNDPIAFSTVTDANTKRGLLGLLTGTGTILLSTSEVPGKVIRICWVPKVQDVQTLITARAGVRKARMLSSV